MSREDSVLWDRARRAQAKLVDRFIHHPDVSLIDLGYASGHSEETTEIVLRIHVRERWMKADPEARVAFPDQVEGIPVVVIPGEYHLESDSRAASEEQNHPG
jgi:hypothetical protein